MSAIKNFNWQADVLRPQVRPIAGESPADFGLSIDGELAQPVKIEFTDERSKSYEMAPGIHLPPTAQDKKGTLWISW